MLTQDQRLLAIATPLADDELVFYQGEILEELGRPFVYDVELFSENDHIVLEDLLGQNSTIRLETSNETRYFNGVITEFKQLESKDGLSYYQAIIRPWLWLLKLSENCRIFQEKSYPEIIKSVFDDLGFSEYEDRLTATYSPIDYTVQFNESDFNFISRIFEQEGIFYYFEHIDGKHTLILVDNNSSMPDLGDITYFPPEESNNPFNDDAISQWENTKKIRTSGVRLTDFDFEVPSKKLESVSSDATVASLSTIEKFNYPGKYKERADGTSYTRLLMERENVQFETKYGETQHREFYVGAYFNLTDHYRSDQNRQYMLSKVSLLLRSDSYLSANKQDESPMCVCKFTAIPSDVVFRNHAIAKRPKMSGPQTAIVVGKAGEEIWTDKYGRVKVHFHWDRQSNGDEKSSCWIRVAQTWAGKNWGSMQIPRIGQEVIVEFLNGDPDQPIIIGSVYNGSTMPPYELPANATISGVKSRSSKGGSGFNELRFEDKKGEEQIFIHGEKNQDVRIKNDCFESIGNDRHLIIKNDQFEKVENNRNEEVKADHIEKIGKDRHLSVKGKEAKEVTKTLSLTVKGDVSEVFKANHSMQVTDDSFIKGTNICIEASDNITLKVGGSYIAIESSGIKIATSGDIVLDAGGKLDADAGSNMKLEAGANATLKAGANAKVEAGGMGDFKAGGIATVKGSMVKIN